MFYLSLPVCFLVIGAVVCAPERVQSDHEVHEEPSDSPQLAHVALEKRSPHYDFGLGKRAYTYVSEYKRLPVYNFGLGKRSRPYSFGLGKRSINEDAPEDNEIDPEALAQIFAIEDDDDNSPGYTKRARPYSFGLGKRDDDSSPTFDIAEEKRSRAYDFGLGKRARTYDFGLGKRLPMYDFGLGKRGKNYNFGLGKRLSSKFNFGLGKRERDIHRFNFGLGKRSADDTFDNVNYSDE